MAKKILLQELSELLSEREALSRREADAFVRAFFEEIQTGLLEDKLVKIKGFGTFKLVEVSERESVNVNTGERITISSHSKVSFTPDASLKELVNRPFAHFEAVDLNDETEMEELEEIDKQSLETAPNSTDADPSSLTPQPPLPEERGSTPEEAEEGEDEGVEEMDTPLEAAAPVLPVASEKVIAEEAVEEAEPAESEAQPADAEAQPAESATPPASEQSEQETSDTEPMSPSPTQPEDLGYTYVETPRRPRLNWWKITALTLLVLFLMAGSYFAGYYRVLCPCGFLDPAPQPAPASVKTQPAPAPTGQPAAEKPKQDNPAVQQQSADEKKKAEAAQQQAAAAQAKGQQTQPADKAGAATTQGKATAVQGKAATAQGKGTAAQGKTTTAQGASSAAKSASESAQPAPEAPRYHTVKTGDNLTRISRRYYGTDKKVRAIIRLNNLKDADDIRTGMRLRLP